MTNAFVQEQFIWGKILFAKLYKRSKCSKRITGLITVNRVVYIYMACLVLRLGNCSLNVTVLNYLVNTSCYDLEAKLIWFHSYMIKNLQYISYFCKNYYLKAAFFLQQLLLKSYSNAIASRVVIMLPKHTSSICKLLSTNNRFLFTYMYIAPKYSWILIALSCQSDTISPALSFKWLAQFCNCPISQID